MPKKIIHFKSRLTTKCVTAMDEWQRMSPQCAVIHAQGLNIMELRECMFHCDDVINPIYDVKRNKTPKNGKPKKNNKRDRGKGNDGDGNPTKKQRFDGKCDYCGKPNHKAKQCRTRIKDEKRAKPKPKKPSNRKCGICGRFGHRSKNCNSNKGGGGKPKPKGGYGGGKGGGGNGGRRKCFRCEQSG
ncbi:MAG: hypothetical protein GY928_21715, partial [Colwellia sp.]|nr:hypothetical protein [Colwellia sp.]